MIPRPAIITDIPAILDIWNPVIRDTDFTFTTTEKTSGDIAAMIARHASPGHATIVAEIAGQIAGFAAFAPFRAGPGYIRTLEHSIHVDPAHRGHGTGRALVADLTDRARAQGAGSLWAGISGTNTGALTFHARLGFAAVAVLPRTGWKNDRWLDLHLMAKWLAAGDNPADTAAPPR